MKNNGIDRELNFVITDSEEEVAHMKETADDDASRSLNWVKQ